MTPAALLLDCLRAIAADTAPELAQDADPGWIAFIRLALQHQVCGLAATALARLPPGRVPPPITALLQAHAREILAHRAVSLAELTRLLAALEDAAIPAMPIKGPALHQRVFADIPAGPSRDLDILIRRADAEAATSVLRACGYTGDEDLSARQTHALGAFRGQTILRRDDGCFLVEPHWSYTPATLGIRIDTDAVWARARAAAGLRLMAPEDEAALLVIHGGKEEWTKLKWLADLAAFIRATPEIDWPAVQTAARRGRYDRMLRLAAILLDRVYAIRIATAKPDAALTTLAGTIIARWHAEAGAAEPEAATISRLSPTRLALCDGPAARARYILRTITTPRAAHYRIVRLPDRLTFLYIPLKLAHDYAALPLWRRLRRAG